MPAGTSPVVLLCGDLGDTPSPLRIGELIARMRRGQPSVAVIVVPGLCGSQSALSEALRSSRPACVVVGCRGASAPRTEVLGRLRRAGMAMGRAEVLDLRPAEGCSERLALEQSSVLLAAAVARLLSAGTSEPQIERSAMARHGVSRESLLHSFGVEHRWIAAWLPERCSTSSACAACVAACPEEALSQVAGRIVVDGKRCNGCGACVAACRNEAFALGGLELRGLAAAADVLAAAVRGEGVAVGVAITCDDSPTGPRIGDAWLPLHVPSIAMVSAGWLLQLRRAGAAARIEACGDDGCKSRAGDLERFLADLEATFDLVGGESSPARGGTEQSFPSKWSHPAGSAIELREPEATIRALSALGSLGHRPHWRVAGSGCPIGAVRIDQAGCSACEACVRTCPTGALQAGRDATGALRLIFDARRCTACQACVAACPESVITAERVADSELLAVGRHLVATVPVSRCVACGEPLLAGLAPAVLRHRLGQTADLASQVCGDCRLRTSSTHP